ncbi:hypothetical protein DE146DRAFT_391989 [Phaeosphaeria sp. MPI-PUGE-AT-0046c]|nr:hypothetical protein DE146DRAFT_391989 [Phaeosphaeria sp. MPI-PUGE-AT-0046c]
MDDSYLPYYDRSSNPWPSRAKAEQGPGNEAGPERWTYLNAFGLPGTPTDQVSEYRSEAFSSNGPGSQLAHTASDADQPYVQTVHDRDLNLAFDYQPSLYETQGAMDMFYWTPVAYPYSQPSSSNLAPQSFQNHIRAGAVKIRSSRPLSFGTHPLNTHVSRQPSPSAVFHTEQQGRGSRTTITEVDDDDDEAVTRIGYVLSNRKFVCNHQRCVGQSFGRLTELKRHQTTLHAANKPNFWCHEPTCPRSVGGGDKPFHRKDKLAAHVNSMHS